MEATSEGPGADKEPNAPDRQPTPMVGALGLQGHIDAIDGGRVYGWAWNPEGSGERISVDIHHKGELIGTVVADRFRQDLADVKVGDGGHAFVFDLPPAIRDDDTTSIAVYFSASQMPLSRGMPPTVVAPDTDRVENLAQRVDRVEAALQQIFRMLNAIRRGEDDALRDVNSQEFSAVKARAGELDASVRELDQRVAGVERTANAATSFVERLESEIYDRIARRELEDLRRDLVAKFRLSLIVGGCAVVASAMLAYLVLMA